VSDSDVFPLFFLVPPLSRRMEKEDIETTSPCIFLLLSLFLPPHFPFSCVLQEDKGRRGSLPFFSFFYPPFPRAQEERESCLFCFFLLVFPLFWGFFFSSGKRRKYCNEMEDLLSFYPLLFFFPPCLRRQKVEGRVEKEAPLFSLLSFSDFLSFPSSRLRVKRRRLYIEGEGVGRNDRRRRFFSFLSSFPFFPPESSFFSLPAPPFSPERRGGGGGIFFFLPFFPLFFPFFSKFFFSVSICASRGKSGKKIGKTVVDVASPPPPFFFFSHFLPPPHFRPAGTIMRTVGSNKEKGEIKDRLPSFLPPFFPSS